ncbi:MAG: HAD family phosphatase [Clostridia bacterium]|nr:HAD family phosphatase [Clostridia bacterium]
MGKFDGLLICSDLDGTLLRNDKSVSEENLNAIEHFEREGGLFTFITGRMPFFVEDIYNTVRPNAPIGCINGGGIYDYRKQKYLWTRELARDALALVEYADRSIPGLGIQVNTFDKIYFSRENEAMVYFREATGMPNLVAHYWDVHEPIAKIVFGDTREDAILELQALLNNHPLAYRFDFIRSEKMLYEILPKGVSKGSVLLKMAELLGIDPRCTIGIGDYNNDIELLRVAGLGVAVANARPEVKAIADHVTVSNESHAIARIIMNLENGDFPL